ncbi:MAG TPA: EamA family transporter [Thermodesulfobacteriota bacterium]|nr:EamA family transporter [Thermodesulfobacteriota bacterium]
MQKSVSTKGLLNLIVVYVVWGCTFLFIRLAVHEGSGFPPFAMAGSRTLCASIILFYIAKFLKYPWQIPASEKRILLVTGVLLWLGGNGFVAWAERQVSSGYAALVIGTTPMWPVIIEAISERKRPSFSLVFSMLISFMGLGVLVWPVLRQGVRADLASTLALILAAICWSSGSLILQRRPPKAPLVLISAYQQFFGALALISMAILTGEPWPNPTPMAWVGWGYLVIGGSLISFTSYVIAVRTLPISIVMTYAYVNPVVAVLLGWLVLGERITLFTGLGMVLILAGIFGIFLKRIGPGS